MDHQSFRYYIPGIVFLFPIYIVACWISINYLRDTDIKDFVLIGGITTFPAISLPVGWWIYNAYRVCWQKFTKGGYENKEFVKLICKDTKPFYFPCANTILIDFTHIKGIESWIKIELNLFRKTFYPFTSHKKFEKEIEQKGIYPKFTESISDFILFQDKGFDYARSISSVRYGLESSLFSIFLGGFYAFGLKAIWLHLLGKTHNIYVFVIWIVLAILLTIALIIILSIRWKSADKEYDARLILTTLTSMSSNYFDTKFISDNIPSEIIEKINQTVLKARPYAAFDLDNTLLNGDIGEAVFAALIKEQLVQSFGWKDYLALIEQNREAAYKKIIEVMNGLEVNKLKEITNEIISNEESFIEIDVGNIMIPKPNSIMQSLIFYLKTKGIDIYIVTASNKISAEIICWKYFGIPASNVLGAIINTDKKKRIFYDNSEIPFAEGKVNALKKIFKHKPLFTGGDGIWDKNLLDYTTTEGIRFWLGQNENEYQKLKNELYKDLKFYHIPEK